MITLLRTIPLWLWLCIICAAIFGYTLVSLENTQDELARSQEQYKAEQAKSESIRATLDLQRELYKDAQAINDTYDTKTKAIQDENDRLADQLARGGELHVNATCVPGPTRNTAAKSGTDDARPRLDAAAQRDYLNLRAGLQRQAEQIAGLQSYITTVCLKGQTQ